MLNIFNAKNLLKEYFNYDDFRENQKIVIQNIIETDNNILVIMPTGGGKSILYTIPALLFEGLTIIISPLIALMQDQVLNLKSRNIKAEYVSHETNNFNSIKKDISNIKILFISPERFVNDNFFSWLKTIDNKLIALDEAHTFTEYGLTFRASYREFFVKLKELQKERDIKFLALTATASDFIYNDLISNYNFNKVIKFDTFRDNLNISLEIFKTDDEKNNALYSKLNEEDTTLIYTLSRREAEKIYYRNGVKYKKLRYYHSKLPSSEKKRVLEGFLNNSIKIIASTTAFGMGIDKSDVRHVYHAQIPTSIEDYAQQIGRAGRDGKLSNVKMFVSLKDIEERKNIISNNKENLKKELENLKNGKITDNENIKNIFLIRNLISPIENSNLEINIISDLTSYPFLSNLLKLLKNDKNIYILSKKLNVKPWIIEDSLKYLEDKGNITFKQNKYTINPFDFNKELDYLFKDDDIKIEKFNYLLEYIYTKECRHKWLSKYFLNEIEECGNICDNCKNKMLKKEKNEI
jgi:RecQ family ATP-dependent DNA helicase